MRGVPSGPQRRRPPRLFVGLLAVALLLPTAAERGAAASTTSPALITVGEAGDLLPDMELYQLYGLTIRTTTSGRKRLRFGTRAFNNGAGPLEVRGRARSGSEMTELVQWIADDQGTGRELAANGGQMFYAGDGHAHWHISQFINVELYKPANLAGTRLIRKIGFCLIDLVRDTTPPPNASPVRVYYGGACGRSATDAEIKMGISAGWADDYQPLIANQWIDITGLRKGTYRLCAKVNPLGHWLESNTANNYFWYDLWLNARRSRFAVRASGRTACGTFATP